MSNTPYNGLIENVFVPVGVTILSPVALSFSPRKQCMGGFDVLCLRQRRDGGRLRTETKRDKREDLKGDRC